MLENYRVAFLLLLENERRTTYVVRNNSREAGHRQPFEFTAAGTFFPDQVPEFLNQAKNIPLKDTDELARLKIIYAFEAVQRIIRQQLKMMTVPILGAFKDHDSYESFFLPSPVEADAKSVYLYVARLPQVLRGVDLRTYLPNTLLVPEEQLGDLEIFDDDEEFQWYLQRVQEKFR